MRKQLEITYEHIISLENLLAAWEEFVRGKKNKPDVHGFGRNLMDNLIDLHYALAQQTYQHGPYYAFAISDPKPRSIHKASVRDRVLHHAIYRVLYPFFDQTFISDSFSCRVNKGTHASLDRFQLFARQVSRNHTKTCWVLKCDITKFFASVDQDILLYLLRLYIPDQQIMWLLQRVVGSFYSTAPGTGLPLGNLTSQLLVNIYMNEFDQYVKHRLGARHYIRYADDFVLLHEDKVWLERQITLIQNFLWQCLQLQLHPKKVSIQTVASGVDFLGWVHFPEHRVLRTATKRRMLRRVQAQPSKETIQSYFGLLQHGNAHQVAQNLINWFIQT